MTTHVSLNAMAISSMLVAASNRPANGTANERVHEALSHIETRDARLLAETLGDALRQPFCAVTACTLAPVIAIVMQVANDNPGLHYHGFRHTATVATMAAVLAMQAESEIPALEMIALLLAAILHDHRYDPKRIGEPVDSDNESVAIKEAARLLPRIHSPGGLSSGRIAMLMPLVERLIAWTRPSMRPTLGRMIRDEKKDDPAIRLAAILVDADLFESMVLPPREAEKLTRLVGLEHPNRPAPTLLGFYNSLNGQGFLSQPAQRYEPIHRYNVETVRTSQE